MRVEEPGSSVHKCWRALFSSDNLSCVLVSVLETVCLVWFCVCVSHVPLQPYKPLICVSELLKNLCFPPFPRPLSLSLSVSLHVSVFVCLYLSLCLCTLLCVSVSISLYLFLIFLSVSSSYCTSLPPSPPSRYQLSVILWFSFPGFSFVFKFQRTFVGVSYIY